MRFCFLKILSFCLILIWQSYGGLSFYEHYMRSKIIPLIFPGIILSCILTLFQYQCMHWFLSCILTFILTLFSTRYYHPRNKLCLYPIHKGDNLYNFGNFNIYCYIFEVFIYLFVYFLPQIRFLYLSPLRVCILSRFLDWWSGSISSSTTLAPVSSHVAFPELLPSPCSSMSFPNSNLVFFSIFTFLTKTSWSLDKWIGKPLLCSFQCYLESIYWPPLSSYLSAPLGSWFPPSSCRSGEPAGAGR